MTFKATIKKFANQFVNEYATTPDDIEYINGESFCLVASQSFVDSFHEEAKNANDYWKEIIKFNKENNNNFDIEDEKEVKNAELDILQIEIDKILEVMIKAA